VRTEEDEDERKPELAATGDRHSPEPRCCIIAFPAHPVAVPNPALPSAVISALWFPLGPPARLPWPLRYVSPPALSALSPSLRSLPPRHSATPASRPCMSDISAPRPSGRADQLGQPHLPLKGQRRSPLKYTNCGVCISFGKKNFVCSRRIWVFVLDLAIPPPKLYVSKLKRSVAALWSGRLQAVGLC
jgi:hypothetical protein